MVRVFFICLFLFIHLSFKCDKEKIFLSKEIILNEFVSCFEQNNKKNHTEVLTEVLNEFNKANDKEEFWNIMRKLKPKLKSFREFLYTDTTSNYYCKIHSNKNREQFLIYNKKGYLLDFKRKYKKDISVQKYYNATVSNGVGDPPPSVVYDTKYWIENIENKDYAVLVILHLTMITDKILE